MVISSLNQGAGWPSTRPPKYLKTCVSVFTDQILVIFFQIRKFVHSKDLLLFYLILFDPTFLSYPGPNFFLPEFLGSMLPQYMALSVSQFRYVTFVKKKFRLLLSKVGG